MAQTRRRRTNIRHTVRKPHGESYIYLKSGGGLNDCLTQLAACTKYALEHKRSIILEMQKYSATNLDTIFDFSRFPVPVYTNFEEKAAELADAPIEPSWINSVLDDVYKRGPVSKFNFAKSYPSDTVLMYAAGGGGAGDDAVNILSHIRLKPAVLAAYHKKMKECSIPAEYISIHLRATDRKLNITNNITGMLLKDSNAIIKKPSTGNTHADSLRKVGHFIHAHPSIPVFVAGDNPNLINKLRGQYPKIITNIPEHNRCKSNRGCGRLHEHGRTDPNNLSNAIVDLLILAGAKAIMTSQGGYSRLAKKLLKHKEILQNLMSPL